MQVDLAQLRKLAAVRGLVNNQLRRRVWPLLLGISTAPDDGGPPYADSAAGIHRDTQVTYTVHIAIAILCTSLTRSGA